MTVQFGIMKTVFSWQEFERTSWRRAIKFGVLQPLSWMELSSEARCPSSNGLAVVADDRVPQRGQMMVFLRVVRAGWSVFDALTKASGRGGTSGEMGEGPRDESDVAVCAVPPKYIHYCL